MFNMKTVNTETVSRHSMLQNLQSDKNVAKFWYA